MQEITQESYFNRQKSHIGLAQIMSPWEDIKDQNLETQLHCLVNFLKTHLLQLKTSTAFMFILSSPYSKSD